MTTTPTVSPATNNDIHLISIRVGADIGSMVSLERRENYLKVETVRGGQDIYMVEDSTFVADYEATQNTPVEYRATSKLDGVEAVSDWVMADNLDTGGDFLFSLDDPFSGLNIYIESLKSAATTSPRTVVKVWGRPDPVVVSGVRELPSGSLVILTLELNEKDSVAEILSSGQVCVLSPQWPSEGLPDTVYMSIGGVNTTRPSPSAFEPSRRWTMEYQQVFAPPAFWRYPTEEATTWTGVLDDYANWTAVASTTWREVVGI